jgi:beta-galactosidase
MHIGVDYYPEHWPEERWATDARLMREAGFNVVRLAEFAWAFLEPEEGRFCFAWLDRALATLAKNGISAILCTPTAVMPAWCARTYPETLATQKDGSRLVYGVRKNNCFTAGAYRLLSERITRALAEHYAGAANVIGWQTDNEFGHPVCFCATCRAEFQRWLRARHGSLAALNRAWGTHFWGHVYGDWAEIPIPVDSGTHNPGAVLDWQRFVSWLNVRFQRDQVRILRAACPTHFITHNFMGLFSDLDYYELAADLDHVSWDNYPVWGAPHMRYDASAAADVMRGLKRKNFWIMEQTAGPGGWGSFGRNPRPGEIRSIAFQQVAHGADGMVWFRWRTCTAGREQYWHGLLGHDGRPLRRYREAAETAADLHRLADALAGTTVEASVALVYDYESIWALRAQPGFAHNNYHQALARWYNALLRAGVNVDMVRPGTDLKPYRAVFTPDLYLVPDALARQLNAYVKAGGVLVADCRAAVKDETNLCHARTLPGLLRASLGVEIEEYEALPDDVTYRVLGRGPCPGRFSAQHYADWLALAGAEPLAGYGEWHMKTFSAATRNRAGKGWGYYVGTVVKEEAFYDAVVTDVLAKAGVEPLLRPPAGVEASVRSAGSRRLLFLVNHTEDMRRVVLPQPGRDLLAGGRSRRTLTLPRHGVAVLEMPPA